MSDVVDFAALVEGCADEPIHAPGGVQPHGALVGVTPEGQIVVTSANTETVLGAPPPAFLGQPVDALLGDSSSAVLGAAEGDVSQVDRLGRSWEIVGHRSDTLHLLEFEPAPSAIDHASERIHLALRKFHGAATAEQLMTQAAAAVHELTGFDRVLVYRFDDEWNGEVITEITEPVRAEFLGLRFPASDIPPQARALYSRARLRLIADATASPSPLLAIDEASAVRSTCPTCRSGPCRPCTSSTSGTWVSRHRCQWRSSSAIGSGVSSRVITSVARWHRHRELRQAVDLVGQTTSTILGALLEAQSAVTQVNLFRRVDAASDAIAVAGNADPGELLVAIGPAFPAVLDATGAAVVRGSTVLPVGRCPPNELVTSLARHVGSTAARELQVRELSLIDPAWAAHTATGAGAIVVPIEIERDAYPFWFRAETRDTVRWGGDPTEKGVAAPSSLESTVRERGRWAAREGGSMTTRSGATGGSLPEASASATLP